MQTSEAVVPKSYKRLTSRELRHRAGLAWKRGQVQLAEALEKMAMKARVEFKPGQHGFMNMGKNTPYGRELRVLLPR